MVSRLDSLTSSATGHGTWTQRDDYGIDGTTYPGALAFADVDNDGDIDILIGGVLHRNTPANTPPMVAEPGAGSVDSQVSGAIMLSVFGDVDGDGSVDVIVGEDSQGVRVDPSTSQPVADGSAITLRLFLNDGSGGFTGATSLSYDASFASLAVTGTHAQFVDFNGDGSKYSARTRAAYETTHTSLVPRKGALRS
jgi:hypothetical protein